MKALHFSTIIFPKNKIEFIVCAIQDIDDFVLLIDLEFCYHSVLLCLRLFLKRMCWVLQSNLPDCFPNKNSSLK